MSAEGLITLLLTGALAGWVCGLIVKGSGFGPLGNIIVGIVGAFLGNFGLGLLGIGATSLLGHVIIAILGGLAFVWLLARIKR
jgi:uncharacterized membrane protein YeaQ/YmgE (transglycosylase-associated protein family)